MFGKSEEQLAQANARVGQLLRGKYRIERVLGVGGMATVYEATHRNGRRVAVKLLHTSVSLHGGMRKRFLREGHAANAVNHPGAVVVIDDDIAEDGAAFLVMELLEGQNIEKVWANNGKRLPTEQVLAIAFELCDVLDAAHRAGIIHRDIKPENLFVTRDGQLKVLDFGLARIRDGQAKLTATGMVFGTPAFMAPEQACGRSSEVDRQSDIWAVGATMFTLLCGLTVHEADTAQEMIMLAATRKPRSLADVLPDADRRLVTLVDRALAREKELRWPNATAMRMEINATCLALFGTVPKLIVPGDSESLPNLSASHGSEGDSDLIAATEMHTPSLDVSDADSDETSVVDSDETRVASRGVSPSEAPTALHQRAALLAPMAVGPLPPMRPPARPASQHLPAAANQAAHEASSLAPPPHHLRPSERLLAAPHPPAGFAGPSSTPASPSNQAAQPPRPAGAASIDLAAARSLFLSLQQEGIRFFHAYPRASVAVLVGAGTLLLALITALIALAAP